MMMKLDTETHYYFQYLLHKLCILFAGIHFFFAFLFYVTGIQSLVLFNTFSVLLYMVTIFLCTRSRYNLAFILTTCEVIAHAVLCTYLLGDSGFKDALLFLPVLFFVHPTGVRKKLLFFISILLLYVGLSYTEQFGKPVYALHEDVLKSFVVGTSVLIIAIDSYIAYFIHGALSHKRDLNKGLEET